MQSNHVAIRTATTLVISMLLAHSSWGTVVQGSVLDGKSKEPVIGANIFVKEKKFGGSASLAGTYKFTIADAGSYTLVCSFLGYKTVERIVRIDNGQEKMVVDFVLSETSSELNEVVVKGEMDKSTELYALRTEKNSDNIINAMSAKTIQLMPDLTVANLLQRFSGVSVDRNSNGDAQYAIIRGMDQRYNYTLVNGIKIPSPDNKYRFVPMDLFPADLLDRLEVIKTLTPSMEGDAIGGAMNLVMKDAPAQFSVTANAATGINMISSQRQFKTFDSNIVPPQSPAQVYGSNYVATPNDFTYKTFDYQPVNLPLNQVYGFSIGDRVTKDKKLGLIVAGSLQNMLRATNSTFFNPNTQPAAGNIPTFDDIYTRQYTSQQSRYGLHFKADYKYNARHKFKLYSMYVGLDEKQYRHTIDTSLSIGRSIPGTGNTYILDRSRMQNQSIYNATLQGNHVFGKNFKVNWSAVYSLAQNHVPDWAEYETSQRVGYNLEGKQVVIIPQSLYNLKRIWLSNTDRDLTGYLDMSREMSVKGHLIEISAGGLYRDKTRDNLYQSYNLVPRSVNGLIPPFSGTLSPDQFVFNSNEAAQGSQVNPNTYTATEKIIAAYLQGKIFWNEKLDVITGVRFENTEQRYQTVMPLTFEGRTGSITYYDILPSLNAKYRLTPTKNLRASYYQSINRAGFFEIIPYNIQGDYYTEIGNPYLKHTVANNIDLRFEQFPKLFNQILVGVFYKNLTNPIELAYIKNGNSGSALKPGNYGTATNFGVELAVTKYWGDFGVSGNYTYTNSSITTTKLSYDRDASGQLVNTIVNQKRPLQGQSAHIGNLSLLYKNQRLGLDLQAAIVYTGQRIVQVSPYVDLDYWQQAMTTVDFSFEKQMFSRLSFYCKLQNLLNTPLIVSILHNNIYQTGPNALPFQNSDSKILVQREYYGQNVIGGIRFRI